MSDINDIKNQGQLDVIFQNNTSQQISPTDLRQFVASVAPYGGVMRVGNVPAYAVPSVPAPLLLASFNNPGNSLMTFDIANDRIQILAAGIYKITWRLNGEWALGDDISMRVYVNGVLDPDAYSITRGSGATNPVAISVSSYPIPITLAQIATGGISGPGTADIQVYIGGLVAGAPTGFAANVYNSQVECEYISLTKDLF